MAIRIDLNSDMGESYGRWSLGNDADLMEVITSANIACGWHGGDPKVMRETVAMAVERGVGINPLALRVSHNGTQIDALVLSPLGARLQKLMPYKAPPDLSKFLMSPMPGLLVDVAVEAGQQVRAGEKLAVIEAMKMKNVLFAAQDGVVGKISAAKGESLAVDQIILEFV